MNRFFTLLLAASCLTAVGQVTSVTIEVDTVFGGPSDIDPEGQLEGFTSYLLYANFTNPTDVVSAVFADTDVFPGSPSMQVDAPCGCWNPYSESPLLPSVGYYTLLAEFPEFFPDSALLEYDTFWTIGKLKPNDPGSMPMWASFPMVDGANICSEVVNNGLAFISGTSGNWPSNANAGEDLRVVIARITTCGDFEISGNIQAFIEGGTSQDQIQAFTLNSSEITDPSVPSGEQFCGQGTIWDAASQTCIPDNPSDLNYDGCVDVNDFMGHLAAFGLGCEDGVAETPWQCGDPLEYQGYDYATVQIGEQCWFAENLRAENYENGDAIPSNLSDSDWQNTTSGAVAVYGEDEGCTDWSPNIDPCDPAQSLNEYGRLYNWYAVDDARGLCPSAWHVPTDGEWTVMTEHLGGALVAGGQMKMDFGWYDGGNGTNSSGFSGLPGGIRNTSGFFLDAGTFASWWSSSAIGPDAWALYIWQYSENVGGSYPNPQRGLSIRCLKDEE